MADNKNPVMLCVLILLIVVVKVTCLKTNTGSEVELKRLADNITQTNNTVKDTRTSCPLLSTAKVKHHTCQLYSNLDFEHVTDNYNSFWNDTFEDLYTTDKELRNKFMLQVYLVPHSLNRAGWLRTFKQYYFDTTKQVIEVMIKKMKLYKTLTFVWNEMAFLHKWWKTASSAAKKDFQELVKTERLEITTGGWVMPDEATTHLYALLDQLIEGHQWLRGNLNTTPEYGWSINAYGHGATLPYLLSRSHFKGNIIQRVHYAWKRWFAFSRVSDFYWTPSWESMNERRRSKSRLGTRQPAILLTHHMPFDLYTISSCGPNRNVCRDYDFRKKQVVNSENVKRKAETLLEQFHRAGSLVTHKVLMVFLGGDFKYSTEEELDHQFTNYKMIVDYVNKHFDEYQTKMAFGTPKEYFNEMLQRYDNYPTMAGDFLPYGEVFSSGRPDYWTGYYTTRPFMKILGRELEHNLRNAEILFTLTINRVRQKNDNISVAVLEEKYKLLTVARRNLALFQHTDGITGTSKAIVMEDYGRSLLKGIQNTLKIQQYSIEALISSPKNKEDAHEIIEAETSRSSFDELPRKEKILNRKIILFNSLPHSRSDPIRIRTNSSKVLVRDAKDNNLQIQINPVWKITGPLQDTLLLAEEEFEVTFIATLPPLSLSIFFVIEAPEINSETLPEIFCMSCQQKTKIFKVKRNPVGDIRIQNAAMQIMFHGTSGLLSSLTKNASKMEMQLRQWFGAYHSLESGAYVFNAANETHPELNILNEFSMHPQIVVTSGGVSSEVTVFRGADFKHTARIYHADNNSLSHAVFLEVTSRLSVHNAEMFMRFETGIRNGNPPGFYTDSNGFSFQKRRTVPGLGIEGNYYPVTSMVFLQDVKHRLTLLTGHALGASSLEQGRLEVMVDRNSLNDDNKGLGEGVMDNKMTTFRFSLVLESIGGPRNRKKKVVDVDRFYRLPSNFVQHLGNAINYPVTIFYFVKQFDETVVRNVRLLMNSFPCDMHLVNLRTRTNYSSEEFPSNEALLIVHRQGYTCSIGKEVPQNCSQRVGFATGPLFKVADVDDMELTSLTGLHSKGRMSSIRRVKLGPMELQTVKITFKK